MYKFLFVLVSILLIFSKATLERKPEEIYEEEYDTSSNFPEKNNIAPPPSKIKVTPVVTKTGAATHAKKTKIQSAQIPTTIPGRAFCSPPFIMEGNMCKTVLYEEPILSCPKKNSVLEKNQCVTVEELPADLSCQQGTHLENKKCVLKNITSPVAFCPKGFNPAPDDSACISQKVRKGETSCPSGFSSKHGRCEKVMPSPSVPSCPDGYVIQTHGIGKHADCVLLDIVQKEAVCPKDYSVNGSMCTKIITEDPIPDCPHGYKLDGHNYCTTLQKTEPKFVCPTGVFDEHKKVCIVVDFLPPIPKCKAGYNFDRNVCVKIIESPITYSCPPGHKLNNQQCKISEIINPEYGCSDKSKKHDNGCYEINTKPLNEKCHKGEISPEHVCIVKDVTKPRIRCPHGYNKVDELCIKSVNVPANLVCEDGGVLKGKSCVQEILVAGEAYCKNGNMVSGLGCVSTSIRESQLVCPEKHKKNGEECIIIMEDNTEHVCPPGTTTNGKKCESYQTTSPILSCPKGFVMNSDGTCFISDFAEPII